MKAMHKSDGEAFGVLRPGAALVWAFVLIAVRKTKAEKAAPGRRTPYSVALNLLSIFVLFLHMLKQCPRVALEAS